MQSHRSVQLFSLKSLSPEEPLSPQTIISSQLVLRLIESMFELSKFNSSPHIVCIFNYYYSIVVVIACILFHNLYLILLKILFAAFEFKLFKIAILKWFDKITFNLFYDVHVGWCLRESTLLTFLINIVVLQPNNA